MVEDLIEFIGMLGADHEVKDLLEFAQVLGRPAGWPPLFALCSAGAQLDTRMTTGLL